jgi:hypothetical protein
MRPIILLVTRGRLWVNCSYDVIVSEIEVVLHEVEELVRNVHPSEADERLRALLEAIGPAELRVWDPELRATIGRFLPKKRRALFALLDELQQDTRSVIPHVSPAAEPAGHGGAAPLTGGKEVARVVCTLEDTLRELSDRHIFQWATFYRDDLGAYFRDLMLLSDYPDAELGIQATRELFRKHSREIFTKGYLHLSPTSTPTQAQQKGFGGLQRFLDLPLEFYSARLSDELTTTSAVMLRRLTSAMLAGTLEGFASINQGDLKGAEVLAANLRSWLHVTAFVSGDHLGPLNDASISGPTITSIDIVLLPLAQTLDKLISEATGYFPLPAMAQYHPNRRRLDIALQPPTFAPERELIEIQCHLGSVPVPKAALEEALGKRVGVIIAPVASETLSAVAQDSRFDDVFLPVSGDGRDGRDGRDGLKLTQKRLVSTLEAAIYRRQSPRIGDRQLEYNFAREFPLNNPFLTRYYHVVRTSVKDMLRTFERRNGVRLWCSVRRSGKTTAGLDLGATSGDTILINQTCDSTGQSANDSLLYEMICASLTDGKQLSGTFLTDALKACAPEQQLNDRRAVLVLDEYETLFGQLRTAAASEERLRYTVVQPILNQFVAFARDNLLVFLGQQPNAHFILMDQNQLSPYVEQDPFPLFTYSDSEGGEFSELLRTIFRRRATFDSDFANRIYAETSGHPYLTVNIMVEYVEWLIRNKRSGKSLHFSGEDASAFATRMLRRDRISVSPEYEFFRDGAIPQALSPNGKERNPWLYAMYSIIRTIAIENPTTFTCPRGDFVSMVDRLGLPQLGLSADYILNTGSQANFLSYTNLIVYPRIKLLARIASVSTPALA